MTKQQKEFLVNYLQNNVYLMEGRAANATQLQRYTEKWQELAEKLNQFEGAKKNVKQWKEVKDTFRIIIIIFKSPDYYSRL
jgi:hypothetical protein